MSGTIVQWEDLLLHLKADWISILSLHVFPVPVSSGFSSFLPQFTGVNGSLCLYVSPVISFINPASQLHDPNGS